MNNLNLILGCSHALCDGRASTTLLHYKRQIPLCNKCFTAFCDTKPKSDAERIFLAACDPMTRETLDTLAVELQAVL